MGTIGKRGAAGVTAGTENGGIETIGTMGAAVNAAGVDADADAEADAG
jgi:hypothetical protein